MKFRWWVLTLVSLALLVVAPPTLAQEQSGSIEGVVKDSSGGVLPGVTVEARSPAVVGASTAVSNAQGIYRFPALPPGVYTVTATLEGFTPQRSEAVLALGQLLKIDLTMAVGGLSETVEVTGESPLIDVKQNASFATVSKEIIEKIPRGRDFTSVVSQAPGTNQEAYAGGIQVDGASGSENRFIVDGMDTTAMRSGTSNKTVPLDFIQEVQVKSSGYNAEFGGATGGVISAISKAGSNAMHGGGGMYYDSNSLRGAIRPYWRINPFTDAGGNFPGVKEEVYTADYPWQRYDPVLDLGGPLVKDKLWYWVGYSANRTNNERTTKFYYSPTRDYTRTFQWHDQDNYLNWNLNTQVGNNVRFKLSGATTWSRNRGTAPALQPDGSTFVNGSLTDGYTTATYPSTTAWPGDIEEYMDLMYGQTGSNYTNNLFSGSMDWVVTPTFFVNVTAGSLTYDTFQPVELAGDRAIRNFGSSNTTYLPGVIPDNLRYASGYADWPKSTSRTEKAYYSRLFLNANATVFKSFHGQHTMKFGARYERLGTELNQGAQYPTITMYWNSNRATADGRLVRGQYGYYRVRQIYTSGTANSNNFSFWAQDSWTVGDRLTINAGIRTENEHVPNFSSGGSAISFGFQEKLAPRVGFAYDVQGNGKWKAYGSYGHFFDITKLMLPIGAFGGDKWVDYYYTLDTYNWPSISCSDGKTGEGCPGTLIERQDMRHNSAVADPLLTDFFGGETRNTIDADLKPYQTREFTLGLDRELGSTMSVGVRYVHKWLVRAIEDVGVLVPNVGEVYFIANPGFGVTEIMLPDFPNFPTPKAQRDYDSVELRFRKRMSKQWSVNASYVWSRLYGNFSGLASSDEGGRTDPNLSRYFDALYMSYNTKGDVAVGPLATDRPHQVKALMTYDLPWGTGVGLNGTWQSGTPVGAFVTWQGYPVFISTRDSLGRTPFMSRYDLYLQHDFRLFGSHEVNVNVNVDNLFDQKAVIDYNQTKYRNSMNRSDAEFFAGFDVDQKADSIRAAGGNMRLNPIWGLPYSYQGRRAIRLGFKYKF